MATGVHNYDATAANNTTIQKDGGGTHAISDGMATDTIDNVKRQIMADLASWLNWPVKTTAYTAVAYDAVQADTVTTAAFTLTLPSSPYTGHWVKVVAASTWASNNLTIGRGGSTIRGNASDLVLSDAIGAAYEFFYDGSTWQYTQIDLSAYLPLAGGTMTGTLKEAKGADVASATALALGSDGNFFDVTGTTTITSINTVGVGTTVTLQFDAALTLTHHATDLILPGGADITTAAGDRAIFTEYASGDWLCVVYTKADGTAVVGASLGSVSEDILPDADSSRDLGSASNAFAEGHVDDIKTDTFTDRSAAKSIDAVYVTDGTAKAHGSFENSGTASVVSSLNVSSIDDIATGVGDINFTTAFASADYSLVGAAGETSGGGQRVWGLRGSTADGYLAGSFGFVTMNMSGSSTDVDFAGFSAMGDLTS